MKTKDILALGILGVVLVVAGFFLISHLGGGKKQRSAEVEIVQPLDPNFDNNARQILLGRDNNFQAEGFATPSFNFAEGFGNPNPFRPQ